MLPAVKGVFKMRLNKAIINSSLVLLLALGLGGCAANNSASTHKTSHEPTSAKVTKANNHKKAANDSTDQPSTKQESNQAVIETPASYANVNQPASVINPALANSNAVASGNQAPVAGQTNANQSNQLVRPEQNTQQAVNNNDEQELPAPFFYYWVWNDEQGRTHNVDWDMSDIINHNNGTITNEYRYDPIPGQAVQYDSREFNLHYYDGGYQWVVNFDNQINANPNHGVVNRMN